ncbi:MAG: aminopeptidase P N-terminal domain-containing protein [Candidatus Marinimicrobia bacterium]|jgi:Xaa-Pro aminopeptidase|nr:aminopeptidase P N-terminal domain-containing protein [Candidatus Neomarinimicrobiota bacterium]|tara:strand:- start:2908 stop:4359 length:1452 start_codon:yes stop_codon:yes gene_type:complete
MKNRTIILSILLLNVAWGESIFSSEEFKSRRTKLAKAMGTGSIAILQGAPSETGYVKFRQYNEFYYLTGIETPHAYVMIKGETGETTLYLPHKNPRRERSEGHLISAENVDGAKAVSGADNVYSIEMMGEHLWRMRMRSKPIVYLYQSPPERHAESRDLLLRYEGDIQNDPWDHTEPRYKNFIKNMSDQMLGSEIRDLTPILDQLRLIKSPAEIAVIKKATVLSCLGLMEAMRSAKPGMYEYELDGMAKYIYHINGAQGDAYYSLIANGPNAYMPHYHEKMDQLKDGDLMLMDYSPDYQYYMSDITRMIPVNGKFSKEQAQLYGFYMKCYRAILDHIRPHVAPIEVRKEAAEEMNRILSKTTFDQSHHRKAAENFVNNYTRSGKRKYASLGHGVGMATHDVGDHSKMLLPGMVFTIEPALRVPEENIYIRLEDLIVITETGAEIISDFVPMDIRGIEKLMREKGMLDRYKPLTAEDYKKYLKK